MVSLERGIPGFHPDESRLDQVKSLIELCRGTNQCYAINEAINFFQNNKMPLYYKNINNEGGEQQLVRYLATTGTETNIPEDNDQWYPPNKPTHNMEQVGSRFTEKHTPLSPEKFDSYENRPGDGVVGPFSSQKQMVKALGFENMQDLTYLSIYANIRDKLIQVGKRVCKSNSLVSSFWALVVLKEINRLINGIALVCTST